LPSPTARSRRDGILLPPCESRTPIASAYPEYGYSDANKNSGLTWDEATLREYLKDPRAKVPGTKMMYPGLRKAEDIDNVIAFLKQYGPNGKLGEAQSAPGVPRPPL
jgi:hypothetical protein